MANTDKAKIYSRARKGWVELGGKRFFARSGWESNYAHYLQFQKDHKLILDWDHETDTFWFNGVKRGCVSYLPDFKVTTPSGIEYHEVKGWMDQKSATKIKRMSEYHPLVKLVVIDESRYKAIEKSCSGFIPGWKTLSGRVVSRKAATKADEKTTIEITHNITTP